MAAPRSFMGIKLAEYSLDDSTWVEVTKIAADLSGVTFPDQEGNPQTYYKGQYAGPEYRVYTLATLNRTIYDILYALWVADTPFAFRVTLDNDELHKWGLKLPANMKPADITGIVEGRGDVHMMVFNMLKDEVTETTA